MTLNPVLRKTSDHQSDKSLERNSSEEALISQNYKKFKMKLKNIDKVSINYRNRMNMNKDLDTITPPRDQRDEMNRSAYRGAQ